MIRAVVYIRKYIVGTINTARTAVLIVGKLFWNVSGATDVSVHQS